MKKKIPFARKRFGQHFLVDKNIVQQIITVLAPKPCENLVEIGPGQGALTQEILARVQRLTVLELDRDLIPRLRLACLDVGELTIEQVDVLNFDFHVLISRNNKPNVSKLRVFGNLPYNISTPLLFHLLEQKDVIQDMHFMLQQEVVDRIIAAPGSKTYGRLSVMVQYHCQTEKLFNVSHHCFAPPPRVESAFIRLIPHVQLPYPVKNYQVFKGVVNKAFQQRRKTLHNSLKEVLDTAALEQLGIDPNIRAERLSLCDFVRIADGVSKI